LLLKLVLNNARQISVLDKIVWIRTPIIRGYSDPVANIKNNAPHQRELIL